MQKKNEMASTDVSEIESNKKHSGLLADFDKLIGGQALVFRVDFDPFPFFNELIRERGKVFHYEYLKKGPEIFEVRITRFSREGKSMTIGEMVANDFGKAGVLHEFGADFCSNGKNTLEEECREKKINFQELSKALVEYENKPYKRYHDFINWPVEFLTDYILNTHHRYVNESLPVISDICTKASALYGNHYPEIIEISKLYVDLVVLELSTHIPKEESILFPNIRKIIKAKKNGSSLSGITGMTETISLMEAEHVSSIENLRKIAVLSNNYTPPPDAGPVVRSLFNKLKEFEDDLREHIHLENNILFPKAILLEKEFFSSR